VSGHTEEPWMIASRLEYSNGRQLLVWGPKGPGHGAVAEAHTEADAARIVSCVNACAGLADPGAVSDLLAALEEVADDFAGTLESEWGHPESVSPALVRARAAIARARNSEARA